MNIGKNAATPIAAAVDDYLECFRILAPHADYVAINVSSPNTEGLRQLQEAEQLQPIVERWSKRAINCRRRPDAGAIAGEGSPDLAPAELVRSARLACETGIDGIIATNTTLNRSGSRSAGVRRAAG